MNKLATDGGLAGARSEADRWYRLYCEKETENNLLKGQIRELENALSIARSGQLSGKEVK